MSAAFTVLLASAGNPDYDEDPNQSVPGVPRRRAGVSTLAEASRVCQAYIAEFSLGGGQWVGGQVYRGRTLVAQISYNGRAWDPTQTEVAL